MQNNPSPVEIHGTALHYFGKEVGLMKYILTVGDKISDCVLKEIRELKDL